MSLEECDVTDLGHPQGAMLARRGHTIGKPRSAPGTVSFHTATSHAAVDDSKPDCDDQSDCQGSAPGWNYCTAELPAKGLVDSRLPARPHQQHHVDTRHLQLGQALLSIARQRHIKAQLQDMQRSLEDSYTCTASKDLPNLSGILPFKLALQSNPGNSRQAEGAQGLPGKPVGTAPCASSWRAAGDSAVSHRQ